jgi:hypothetical protein
VHERLHCGFIRPTSGSPKNITTLAEQLRPEISIRFGGLAGCAKSLQEKHRQIAPGTNSQTCDGNHSHIESLSLRSVPMSMPSETPADLLSRLSARTINIRHICPPLGRNTALSEKWRYRKSERVQFPNYRLHAHDLDLPTGWLHNRSEWDFG